jgi:pyrroline-5-carboxylate reductase
MNPTDERNVARGPLAILGGGNLGRALALGWVGAGRFEPGEIFINRRRPELLSDLADAGFVVDANNAEAVCRSRIVLIAVQPQQHIALIDEIKPHVDSDRHLIVSVVSSVTIDDLRERLGTIVPIVRAMPNTGIAIGESMTCLAAEPGSEEALSVAVDLFNVVGRTMVIGEQMMVGATALCACGVAFFLRSIRAASQGGIEIGFHPEEALLLAAQTARGAASLLLRDDEYHPEAEIDRVTTPRGCTIAGLNEMEHQGFSSALIKGILLSAEKAEGLYRSN